MSQNLVIEFQNQDGSSKFELEYELFDNIFTKKWVQFMRLCLSQNYSIDSDGHFYGKIFDSVEDLQLKLQQCVDYVNDFCEKNHLQECVIQKQPKDNKLNREYLNYLHLQFEKIEPLDKFQANQDVLKQLMDMNIYIHRAEEFLPGRENDDNFHIEILLSPHHRGPLAKGDYKFFDMDLKWGHLYLTYGMTGVPTQVAYQADSQATPQSVFSNGVFLNFKKDVFFPDEQRAEIIEWYRENHEGNLSDQELALGYIPLGRVINPFNSKEELRNHMAIHKKAVGVSIKKVKEELISDAVLNHSAAWPYDDEIFLHLDYKPYIDLNIEFNAAPLLEEAKKCQNFFVTHRSFDQSSYAGSQWKSLGLQTVHGDYQKTSYHTEYGLEEGDYRLTPFATLCPETMKLVSQITDIEKCDRIRFMLLGPGAKIHTHRDAKDRNVSMAINISLNMPDECFFFSDLSPDGQLNKYTTQVPFSDKGSVVLFNNAKYHSVVNHSQTPRFHIIIHGPLKVSDETLIKLARAQNQIHSKDELVQKLLVKKQELREAIYQDDHFLKFARKDKLEQTFSLST